MKALTLPALLLSASPLWALTPQEVLDDWQGFSARNGAGFTFARQESSAAEITLYDVLLSGELSPVLPWLKLTAAPDGAVDISTQEIVEWDNTYTATQFSSAGKLAFEGLNIQATGSHGDIRYEVSLARYTAETHTGALDFSTEDSQNLSKLSGWLRHQWSAESGDIFAVQLTSESWQSESAQQLRDTPASVKQRYIENQAIEGSYSLSTPKNSWLTYSSGNMMQSLTEGPGNGFENHIGTVVFSLNAQPEAPEIMVTLTDFSMAMRAPMPAAPSIFAFTFDTAQLSASIQERVAGATYPWQVDAKLENLVFAPETWAALDPASALPHGPSHVQAHLTGTGLAPAGERALLTSVFMWLPELKSLNLAQLDIGFGSLALLADGNLRFSDAPRGFGLPQFNGGQINLRLQGAKTLLDVVSTRPSLSGLTRELSSILEQAAPSGQPANNLNLRMAFQPDGAVTYSPLPD